MNDQQPAAGTNIYQTRASIFARLNSSEPVDRELAWGDFRSRYSPVIAGFAAKCGASRQDIDDIIQDVMTNFFGVSREFVYDASKGRFRGMPLDQLPDAEIAVEQVWEDVWEQQLVSQALLLLREEMGGSTAFRAFEQYVLLDRDAEVVAHELSTSVNNVHQAKARITKRLREVVQKLKETDG